MFRGILGLIATIAVVVGVIFGVSYGGYLLYDFFTPRYEQVRYNTFKESQSYNDGMLRELRRLQVEYHKAEVANDEAGKLLLRSQIRDESASFDTNRLPTDLRTFVQQVSN